MTRLSLHRRTRRVPRLPKPARFRLQGQSREFEHVTDPSSCCFLDEVG